ncbi:MAG: TIR domain-containing protein, partial [bacterium]|nr:TIR domain-containing protein [bacterium]
IRFIVMMHQWIADQQWVWRSGVVLEKDGAKAEVIEHYGKREIRIRVAGKRIDRLLTIIMYELDRLNDSFHQLKYDKLFPCNCGPCKTEKEPYFHRYEVLDRAMKKKRETVECQVSFDPVNVRSLIEEVMDTSLYKTQKSNPFDRNAETETVFISYSHDSTQHAQRVLKLGEKLLAAGVECVLDQWETSPPEGWPKWMDRNIEEADFVLVVCTETYFKRVSGKEEKGKGKGVKWESTLAYNDIYHDDSRNTRFIPVLFDP